MVYKVFWHTFLRGRHGKDYYLHFTAEELEAEDIEYLAWDHSAGEWQDWAYTQSSDT